MVGNYYDEECFTLLEIHHDSYSSEVRKAIAMVLGNVLNNKSIKILKKMQYY